ncbi:hypothetical protein RUM43_012215 [Polyplax serrata]|uniref:Ras-GEF domain-containing protein n=1 Tax=Polyplax serrata TaxID=468196 RepID=A0AAN8P3C2_POLSC
MSLNRIQKLLFSEYSDFEDMVLVESPFAETTREGRGIRQVQIGLTPTKLVLATDIIKHACDYPVAFFPGCIDAEIESLELISIFPIELVTLSVFRRRRRKVLKAKFHDGNPNHNCKIVYFELGGSDKRKMFWNLWCERVRFLSPEDRAGSSLTETSVASSTSASSLHVAKTRVSKDKIWQYYAGKQNGVYNSSLKKNLRWTDKDLFFGDKLELISYKLQPISYATLLQNDSDEIKTLYRRQKFQTSRSSLSTNPSKEVSVNSMKKAEHINRFGEGIDEGCKTGLYLPAMSYSKYSFSIQSTDSQMVPQMGPKYTPSAFTKICDEAVQSWETANMEAKENRHPRHYGLTTMSDLFYGFGMYKTGRGDAFSLQIKKSVSLICLMDETVTEYEFEKPTMKLHLCNSTSHESVRPWSSQHVVEQQPLQFWTTNFWFRPNTIRTIYRGNQTYLKKISMYLRTKGSNHGLNIPRKMRLMNFGKKLLRNSKVFNLDYEESATDLKEKLKMETEMSIWDIDSTTMAFQLTMLDTQLFLKVSPVGKGLGMSAKVLFLYNDGVIFPQVPPGELRLLLINRNGKSCLNLMSWIIFSHRISCLVATEILLTEDIKYRARLISRFINAAEKCHLLHNFQSCRSILSGLQSPAIYRLKLTWCQVRHNHATKYQIFEKLSRLYRDPRLTCYQKAFYKSSLEQPYLPSAMHILATFLGLTVKQQLKAWSSTSLSQDMIYFPVNEIGAPKNMAIVEQCQAGKKASVPKLLKQIFSALKIYPSERGSKQEISLKSGKSGKVEKQRDRGDRGDNNSDYSADPYSPLVHLDPLSPEEMFNVTMKTFLQHFQHESEVGSGFEDAENLLRNGQKAARKYDLSENCLAKCFLLKMPYKERQDCYFDSFRIEPD